MPFSNYSELKTAVKKYLQRDDLEDADLAEFVTLCEADFNRELDAVTVDATLTGVVGSNQIDISSLSLDHPIALFMTVNGIEREMVEKANGSFAQTTMTDRPAFWAIDGDNIEFNCRCDQAYSFRLVYDQRFVLSDSATTNWVLTNHPDIYLKGCLAYGRTLESDGQSVSNWLTWLNKSLVKVRRAAGLKRRSTLSPDATIAGLLRFGRRGGYDGS